MHPATLGKHVECTFRFLAIDTAASVQHFHRHVAPIALRGDLLGHAILKVHPAPPPPPPGPPTTYRPSPGPAC